MLQGTDVSSYQPYNFNTSGLSFAFIKITEGLHYVNPEWQGQRATAKTAGLVRGFYHYPRISQDPIAEADFFLSQISLEPGDVLVLDWEWYGQNVSSQQALDYRAKWIPHVQSKAPGHKVILYSDLNNWRNVDSTGYCGDGLWIADYTTAGQPRTSFRWLFHQYTDSPQDMDVANFASIDDLRNWAGAPSTNHAPAWPGYDFQLQSNEMHDGNIFNWQQQMARRGWPVTADGWYGPKSQDICRQFQQDSCNHGWSLTVDGIVGQQTWNATWNRPVS